MLRLMKRLIILFLLLTGVSYGQKIQVLENTTLESVPFVKVYPVGGNPFLADIDGYFQLPDNCEQFTLRMNGFADTTYHNEGQTSVILRVLGNDLEEVVVLPGINPAERIMELAINNRKKNHPMGDETFRYTSYSKFLFTLNPDAVAAISDTTTDTTLIDIRDLFSKQHLFLMESTTEKSFEPPFREKEIITAYKVSGFSDPMFSTFASELQTFNFYENQFDLLGQSYINPLAFGGIRRYLFILEDSTVNAPGDTTFTIRFQPRKDKNFDGMKGTLYINSRGYALEKVIAEPAEKSESLEPKIIQEYVLIDGMKWFPKKLSTEAVFPAFRLNSKLKDGYLVAKGTTYIEDIRLGLDLSKVKFNAATVQTADDANEKDSAHWNQNRTYQLNQKETTTYQQIDSLSKANDLEAKVSVMSSILEGKIPVGYIQFDLNRLLDYRDYEGYRVGLGIENSKKWMKRATVGAYVAYGTRDKSWKYGGYGKVMLFPKQFISLEGRFQQDLVERGGYQFLAVERGLNVDALYRHLYIRNMEKQRLAEVAVSGYVTPNLKWLVSMNYQRVQFTQGYAYTNSDMPIGATQHFEVAEATMEWIWTIREKVMYLGNKRVSLGSKWPKLSAKWAQSIPNVFHSALQYARLNVDLQQDIVIRGAGKLSYLISAGKTIGNVPLYLNQVALGTGGNWNISVANTFETILPSAFYATQQAAVFTRFTFKALKTGMKWTTPQLVLHHAMGTGSFDRAQDHTVVFRTMNKGYYEGGLLLNKLLNIGSTGFGIGGFYNYGAYASSNWKDNVTLKIGLTVGLN